MDEEANHIEVGGGGGAIAQENLRWGAEAVRVMEAVPSPVVARSSVHKNQPRFNHKHTESANSGASIQIKRGENPR
jgi:hypothetical protein